MTEVIITHPLETMPVDEFFDRAEAAVRSASYNGVPIAEDLRIRTDEEMRELNERAFAVVRASIAALEMEKAEVIALLSESITVENQETIARAIALIEEVYYD